MTTDGTLIVLKVLKVDDMEGEDDTRQQNHHAQHRTPDQQSLLHAVIDGRPGRLLRANGFGLFQRNIFEQRLQVQIEGIGGGAE